MADASDKGSREAFDFALQQFGTRHRDTPRSARVAWVSSTIILAIAAQFVPGLENRLLIAGALLATMPVDFMWHRILPDQYNEHSRPAFDGVVAVSIAALTASAWTPALIAYALALSISVRERLPRAYAALHVCLMATMAVIGAVHEVPFWLASMVVLNVLLLLRYISEPTWMDRVVTDRVELVKARDELERQTLTDSSTGLANRRALTAELARRLDTEHAKRTGLLMMDLNRFKQINDTLGHAAGDRALKIVGERITAAAGDAGVFRLGGDEFAVIVDDPSTMGVLALRIGNACNAPFEIDGVPLSISVSLGSAIAPDDAHSPGKLLRCSDLAMYHAKKQKIRHVHFGPELAAVSADELRLSARIGEALRAGEFEMWFQPMVELGTGRLVGAEALARWRHPERGILTPGYFIKLVTLSHRHEMFTDVVVRHSASMAAKLAEAGHEVPISINLPMTEFLRCDLVRRLETILDEFNVGPKALTIEVTEDTLMELDTTVEATVKELADAGFRLSIDDFGTGYSSFERLVDLPVGELKIDRRFVTGAGLKRKERAVVESIIDLAQRLDLNVVAEGIETADELDLMDTIGATTAQGYYWCRPLPAEEFLNLVLVHDGVLPASDPEPAGRFELLQ